MNKDRKLSHQSILVLLIIALLIWNASFLQLSIISICFAQEIHEYPLENSASSTAIPSNPILMVDSHDTLYLIFRENYGSYSKLAMLKTNSEGDWNKTLTIIHEPINGSCINSYPSAIFFQEKIIIYLTSIDGIQSYITLLEINPSNLETNTLLEFTTNETIYSNPKVLSSNETLWLSWLNRNESKNNLYYAKYNYTSQTLSVNHLVSNSSYGSCFASDLAIDKFGAGHFLWSQGANYHNYIFYKKIANNESCLMHERLIDNSYYYIDPEIFVEEDGRVNTFWSNISDIAPSMLGTKSVLYCSYTPVENWSTAATVAPYRPADRIDMMTDGENPEVAHDNIDTLWMAYEIEEPIQYFRGIAIRGRENGVWQNGEPVSLSQAPGYDPSLAVDSEGHVHCVWIDFRWSVHDIYYRARYNMDIWSFEEKLTNYTISAATIEGPRMFGFYIGAVVLFGIILPSTYYIAKGIRRKKIMKERLKEIVDE